MSGARWIVSQVAKLFTNGRSQAVRLPAAFRFDTPEVFIRQDAETGDVILSRKPADWAEFQTLLRSTEIPGDFLSDDERAQALAIAPERDPLDGLAE
jgi:antitoxin VapB